MESNSQEKPSVAAILDLADDLTRVMKERGKAVVVPGDDLAPLRDANRTMTPRARLEAQVKDLDRLFVGLAQRAARCGDVQAVQLHLGLALRCQRQAMQSATALLDLEKRGPRPAVADITDVD